MDLPYGLAKGWDCQRGQQYHYYSFLHWVHFLAGGEKPIASHEGQLMFDCLGLYPETARPGSRKTIVH
jgi:hypothetical protein